MCLVHGASSHIGGAGVFMAEILHIASEYGEYEMCMWLQSNSAACRQLMDCYGYRLALMWMAIELKQTGTYTHKYWTLPQPNVIQSYLSLLLSVFISLWLFFTSYIWMCIWFQFRWMWGWRIQHAFDSLSRVLNIFN